MKDDIRISRWEYLFCELRLKEAEEKATGRNRETAARCHERKQFI